MIDSAVFIGAIIIALTQVIKFLSPVVTGVLTVVVSVLVGLVVALLSGPLGLDQISVAQGILTALAACGVHTVASSTATNLRTPTRKV